MEETKSGEEQNILEVPGDWEYQTDRYYEQMEKENEKTPSIAVTKWVTKAIIFLLSDRNKEFQEHIEKLNAKPDSENTVLVCYLRVYLDLLKLTGFLLWVPTRAIAPTPQWRGLVQTFLKRLRERKFLDEVNYLGLANYTEIICEKGRKLTEEELKNLTSGKAIKPEKDL
jgi:hypothetical protein